LYADDTYVMLTDTNLEMLTDTNLDQLEKRVNLELEKINT